MTCTFDLTFQVKITLSNVAIAHHSQPSSPIHPTVGAFASWTKNQSTNGLTEQNFWKPDSRCLFLMKVFNESKEKKGKWRKGRERRKSKKRCRSFEGKAVTNRLFSISHIERREWNHVNWWKMLMEIVWSSSISTVVHVCSVRNSWFSKRDLRCNFVPLFSLLFTSDLIRILQEHSSLNTTATRGVFDGGLGGGRPPKLSGP